jgi:two-component system sensor histidine kinase KdpD
MCAVAESRPNADQLLASIQREEKRSGRGRLKIFLGMCPGVGKTYAMLEAAQRERTAGRDVVIGYVETHGRKETDALAAGFEPIPRRTVEYRGVALTEMDLDAVLARRPELALVDELAHTNAPGCRHPKRWQDVQELLDAGIHVFTTLNIQHVESRADTVKQITGAEIRETVPDTVLDEAVLELVDLPPAELIQRLHEGKVYVPDRAAAAVQNFFREANLSALRELALRLVADHAGEDTIDFKRTTEPTAGPWKTGNRLLVGVSPSPLSEPLIRWTRRMADELRCPWLAVHVEASRALDEAAQTRLARNLETARELGAEVITTTDDSLARGLLRVSRERDVTQIILGKPVGGGAIARFRSGRLVKRLMQESGDIDLHVVKAEKAAVGSPKWRLPAAMAPTLNQYTLAVGVIAATCLVNVGLNALAGPRVPGLVFLLAVVLLALFVGRGPVLVAGALSALVWNYFFLPPRFTFIIQRAEDAVLFAIYFVVAVVLGQLVARIRVQAEAERRREERSTALYELTRELAEAGSRDQVIWQLLGQVNRVFRASGAVCLAVADKLESHPDSTLAITEKELGVADWAFRHRKAAGRFTDNLPGAAALHLPLATDRKTLGVLAVALTENNLPLAQRNLLETFARQAALVLERVELRAAAEQTRLLAESERLGKTLLNSVSHELRTPLAAITSGATGLRDAGPLTPAQARLVAEVDEAAGRLNRLVRNLLDLSRLEGGTLHPKPDWHDLRDLIHTTVQNACPALAAHPINIAVDADLPLVKLDFAITEQILANLLSNAVVHTPAGTPVEVRASTDDGELIIEVADRGPGLPPGDPNRLFDRFQRGPNAPPGGTGIGLSLVKGFAEAQGGTATAANRLGGGAIFTVRLPLPKMPPVPRDKE